MTAPDHVVTYYVADLVSGIVLDTLPITGEISDTRGQIETQSWNLPITDERTPANWYGITQPWRVMIVAEWRGRLIQAWVIVGRTFGSAEVELQGATLERLTEVVLVRSGDWFSVDAARVAAEIVAQVMVPEGGWRVEWTPTGTKIDHFQQLDAAQTVNDDLEVLEAAEGGPRWMKLVRWAGGEEGRRVEKIIRIGTALGRPQPNAIFRMYRSTYTRAELWDDNNAALRVWGATEGSGSGMTPTPYESALIADGWHPKELVASFSDLDDAQLEARKRQRGRELEDGTIAWEATFSIDDAPLLGDEWNIGDTVTLRAEPTDYDPIGGELTAEVEGFVLNVAANEITPRVVQEGADREEGSTDG